MEGGVQDVGVRAAEHALDAALAEHRRAVRLAADARERERIARSRAAKEAAGRRTDAALTAARRAPDARRPAGGDVDRGRAPAPPVVCGEISAQLGDAELRVTRRGLGRAGWLLAPGEGPPPRRE